MNDLFFIGQDACKYNFAKEHINTLGKEEFEYFKPTLDLILSIIQTWENNIQKQ